MRSISRDIPSEWYEDDYDSLLRLQEQIFRQPTRVPENRLGKMREHAQPIRPCLQEEYFPNR
jgi:hypothetical protein